MRIRWTAGKRFLHPLLSELRGHGKGSRAGNGKPGASEVVAGLENPSCIRRRRDAERNEVAKLRPLPVEKSRYRVARARTKPTQVDEERILRPAGEVLLRNSAKMTPVTSGEECCASSRREMVQATV